MKRIRAVASARVLCIVACIVGIAWPGIAGTGYSFKCSECEFETALLFGGGIPRGPDSPGRVVIGTGYCRSCGKMVRAMSNPEPKEGEDPKAGDPIGKVFCFDNGKTYTLYPCPECGKPFVAIREEDLLEDGKAKTLYCPKCGEQGLKPTGELAWD
jgi:DNA-directed RNA polymerase subunit RPC12/RpoP